jgi:hypothetical protein
MKKNKKYVLEIKKSKNYLFIKNNNALNKLKNIYIYTLDVLVKKIFNFIV